MKLSILIPSIPQRKDNLERLLSELNKQKLNVEKLELGSIEILTCVTDKFLDGGMSVGQKRDTLVQQAKGKYLCFLDDDDYLAPNYVESLLLATNNDYDVITFNSIFKCDTYWSIVDLELNSINEDCKEGYFKRNAWHICPIKSNIAKTERFNDLNYGEDWDWMQRIIPKLKSSIKLNKILHQYNYSRSTSAVDEILDTLK